jgi:hypothetical protein
MLRKFIIERNVPGIGNERPEGLCAIAKKSNDVLAGMGHDIQWIQSYVTDDKFFCVYLAKDESLIREHAMRGGFPADRIYEVRTIVDPATARA